LSYIRKRTRSQGDRAIKHTQDNFGEGLNVDLPATDINTNANPVLDNYIAYERYAEGRTGSTLANDDLPGSGTIHSIAIHPENGQLVMHRGAKLYSVTSSFVEIQNLGHTESFTFDEDSNLVVFGDDFLLYTASGLFRLYITLSIKSFIPINAQKPLEIASVVAATDKGPFKYKYIYTFSVIIANIGFPANSGHRGTPGNVLVHETPPIRPTGEVGSEAYFLQVSREEEIGISQQIVSILETIPDHVTHISWYRTPDLGQNGLDNLAFDQYAWIDDREVSFPNAADLTFDDTINYRLTHAPNLRLKNIGWEALPNGVLGEVTPGFIFTAALNGKMLSYSQRVPDDTRAGFHDAGTQFQEFDDGINVIAKLPDSLAVIENSTSSIITLTSIIDTGVNQYVATIDHIITIDDDIGVIDGKSFSNADGGTYVSICSDKSVRTFDQSGWGRDLALDHVGGIIDGIKVGATVAKYYKGAYYIWYTLDNDATKPDSCIRFSLKRSSGKGWNTVTGVDWVLPPINTGLMVGSNFNAPSDTKLSYFFVLNESDNKIYWIDSFNGPENITINDFPVVKHYSDKKIFFYADGTQIPCKIRTRDVTGSQRSFNIKHSESHIYYNNSTPEDPLALTISASAFVDDSDTPTDTVTEVPPGDDIQFFRKVEGSRISVEFTSNRSGHRVISIDGRFRVQDINRPNAGPSKSLEGTMQADLQGKINLWTFTRPAPLLSRIDNKKFPLGNIQTQLGPDGRTKAVQVGVGSNEVNPFLFPDRSSYNTEEGSFSALFWVGGLDFSGPPVVLFTVYNLDGTIGLQLYATNATTLILFNTSLGIVGTFTVDDLNAGPTNGYHQIFVYSPALGTLDIKQNGVSKGLTFAFITFGGGGIELGGVAI